jgi:hypothetical protein
MSKIFDMIFRIYKPPCFIICVIRREGNARHRLMRWGAKGTKESTNKELNQRGNDYWVVYARRKKIGETMTIGLCMLEAPKWWSDIKRRYFVLFYKELEIKT